ncbi:hypothetical protein ACFWYW_12965 [Nonomuraea sp. NPDC059023]|uniref:hypothetical protein n=1 Tax=unclassified Nonomuraea TaxID=2593643 RepID=UPI0036A7E45A
MTMSKKGSRPITVDGTGFRWQLSHRPGDDRAPLTFAVERAENPGSVLMVSLPCGRPDNHVGERTIAVRPVLVAGCIRQAVKQGWNATQRGPVFTLKLTEDELTTHLGEPPKYLIPFLWGMIPEGGTIKDLPRATQIWTRDNQA